MTIRKWPAKVGVAAATVTVAGGLWAGPVLASTSRGTSSAVAGSAAVGTKARPGLQNCGIGAVVVRPASVILSCADANSVGKDLVWSKWGATGATAKGVFTWNYCKPNCAASKKWGRTTATYTLSDVVRTAKYGWLFEKLTVHITGKQTGGFPRTITYPQKPIA